MFVLVSVGCGRPVTVLTSSAVRPRQLSDHSRPERVEQLPAQLVGTDIVQAIPLVAAATIGHLLYGDVRLALTAALLLGALPGVYLGARLSAQGPATLIRSVVPAVLLASALALLNMALPLLLATVTTTLIVMILLAAWETPR